jgi:multicomponent Na+:H+ antiporter subunit E
MMRSTARTAGFLGFWVILIGLDAADVLVGIPAAVIATWASLRLLPPGQGSLRPSALAQLVLRFLRQSTGAGIDVAWRALDPRLPLRPGFVVHQPRLPQGPARNAFCTMTSLLPGTLPSGPDESGGLAIHCLDVGQPVATQLATEEALLRHALGDGHSNG